MERESYVKMLSIIAVAWYVALAVFYTLSPDYSFFYYDISLIIGSIVFSVILGCFVVAWVLSRKVEDDGCKKYLLVCCLIFVVVSIIAFAVIGGVFLYQTMTGGNFQFADITTHDIAGDHLEDGGWVVNVVENTWIDYIPLVSGIGIFVFSWFVVGEYLYQGWKAKRKSKGNEMSI